MRTTVTLEPDIAARLQKLAQERGASFMTILNDTLRAGLNAERGSTRRYSERTVELGVVPGIDLTKALRLAAELEDEAIVQKLALRK
jgi:hypothetical protein